MTIPALKTPGFYSEVNTNTQRGGLPANTHKVLFLTNDSPAEPMTTPVPIYDKAGADGLFAANSDAGKMITAAIKTNRFVNVEVFAPGEVQPSAT